MTLFSVSLSTKAFWARVLFLQLGIQLEHDTYTAPYLLLECWKYQLYLWWGCIHIRKAHKTVTPWLYDTVYRRMSKGFEFRKDGGKSLQ